MEIKTIEGGVTAPKGFQAAGMAAGIRLLSAGHRAVIVERHRVAGGMRASIYNAMPMAGVDALIAYLKEFEVEHHGK